MGEYKSIKILLTKGDIITSKKGILTKSDISNKFYLVFKAEYMGNGILRAIKKEEVEAKPIGVIENGDSSKN